MGVKDWSTTASNNNSAPPDGWPEGMSPGGVNDVGRKMMADIATEAQTNRVKVLQSTAGTNTITADMDPELVAYAAGMIVVVTPAANNTGGTTLNIDGLGALDVLKQDGDALIADDLVSGVPAVLVLDSGADDFYLINPQTGFAKAGSFTATLTGFASNPTGTVFYSITGSLCTLYTTSAIEGTSNDTAMTMTGLPSAVQPSNVKIAGSWGLRDNSASYLPDAGLFGVARISGSTVTFALGLATGSVVLPGLFTASATKGIRAGWSITYELN